MVPKPFHSRAIGSCGTPLEQTFAIKAPPNREVGAREQKPVAHGDGGVSVVRSRRDHNALFDALADNIQSAAMNSENACGDCGR